MKEADEMDLKLGQLYVEKPERVDSIPFQIASATIVLALIFVDRFSSSEQKIAWIQRAGFLIPLEL